MGTQIDMHLLLSMPAHLAIEAEFVTTTPVDEDGSTETTQAEDDKKEDVSTAGVILQLGIFILIPVAMYFLLIRPRRRMMRQQRTIQKTIEVGDEVLLTSGVYGFVTGMDDGSDIVWVEIDDDVQVRVSRAAISGKVDTTGASTASTDGDAVDAPSATATRPTLKGGYGTSSSVAERPDSAEPVDE